MLIEMPELGSLEQGHVASLAGLAPVRPRQRSVEAANASSAEGAPACARPCYMPALVAVRFNPDLKAKYEALHRRGKSHPKSHSSPSCASF